MKTEKHRKYSMNCMAHVHGAFFLNFLSRYPEYLLFSRSRSMVTEQGQTL